MKFTVTVDRDEDGMWVVECPSIPGCVSQGKTKEESMENIKDAIRLCLEVRMEQGLPLTVETKEIEVTAYKEGHITTLSIPDHPEVAKGTLRSLIRMAWLTVRDFEDAHRGR